MAKVIATVKAIITRIIFGSHGFLAIWQVTQYKKDTIYWYLCTPIVLLCFEGIFTLAIKKNQEWKWFCPSVFLYLGSVVPAIWLLELSKLENKAKVKEEIVNFSAVGADLKNLDKYLGVAIDLPDIEINSETWIMLIEQFLMLILIIGRWMLPKGDLTRDQLSQLLLVYIGTAADIIEFFDSFKDSTIANETLLVFLTLGIWSWSLLQFTIVLSATRSRKARGGGLGNAEEEDESNCCNSCCCTIDVWGIALNIVLQDAPFLAFRLLIIIHYKIISYMNVFFTCKNTLVIMLQLYRLQVVYSENSKNNKKNEKGGKKKKITKKRQQQMKRRQSFDQDDDSIYVISSKSGGGKRSKRNVVADISDDEYHRKRVRNKMRQKSSTRKDTGYSTASSQTTIASHKKHQVSSKSSKKEKIKHKNSRDRDDREDDEKRTKDKHRDRKKLKHSITNSSDEERNTKKSRKADKHIKDVEEVSENSSVYEIVNEKQTSKKKSMPPPPPPPMPKASSSSSSESSE